MTQYRKHQSYYIGADILSALGTWLCFLLFRWLVYEQRIFGWEEMMIPAFNFYRPLVLYPLFCTCIYYLSGYYMRPLEKHLGQELEQTFVSSIVITLCAFFVIIIDDPVKDYSNYTASLMVLWLLQFTLCYICRIFVTLLTRTQAHPRTYTIHTDEDIEQMANASKIKPFDRVIIAPNEPNEEKIYRYINAVYPYKVDIWIEPRLLDVLTGAARISTLDENPMIHITDHKMSDAELCIKRALDVVASSIALIVLSPLLIGIAIAVRLSSPGPILYRQERIGMYGKPFMILKFRTMRANSEGDTPQLTQDNDPRITPLGQMLRKYRLDELPQLINIIRGEMAIVGPRPERAYFIEQITRVAPYYCLIYKVRPGLTSWGPIRVGYTDTIEKMVERLRYDISYMENMSLALDMKILFYTIAVIVDGKGK